MSEQFPLGYDDEKPAESPAEHAVRADYMERLREKLKDRDFRAIEGFPIGSDEAILALSDPPYYTACPNPFLPEIIERWQADRAALRAQLGLPDDAPPPRAGEEPGVGAAANGYHREPFAADVSEGKNDPIYNAHSYHTKVPHKAIMRYILHYTDPGDIVFDGFCGTGMTGVAAQLCGDKRAVESLGYRVDPAGVVYDGQTPISRLGARKSVLVDLSPAATFIAYNYNTPLDAAAFEREAKRILAEVEQECGWMYETWHPHCDHPQRIKGRINYTIWSDVFVCPECGTELAFWDVAVNTEVSEIREKFRCPNCQSEQSKRTLQRAWDATYDRSLGEVSRRARRVPARINYFVGERRYEKVPDAADLRLVETIEDNDTLHWFPTRALPDGEKTVDPMNVGITHSHEFYTRRNLQVLAALWSKASHPLVRFTISALMPRGSRMHRIAGSRVGRVKKSAGGMTIGIVSGTLYVPAVSAETNLLIQFADRVRQVTRVGCERLSAGASTVSTQSSSVFDQPVNEQIDYVFVDPPFGANLQYSELNSIWEAWLQVTTDNAPEAVVNITQRKKLLDYQRLMERCFQAFFRLLRPGRWMTVEFHNSQNSVWNAIQESIMRAGFVVADVRTFDKGQGSFNQYTATGAVKQDLIISAYKPASSFERRFQSQAGGEAGAWAFIEEHLRHLPVSQLRDGRLEVLAERQAYLLFDRMVAFHIQRGLTVPLGAAEFYAGLRQRYPERDGMYFLPLQTPEYDRLRLQAHDVEQLPLIVSDERSAILWLRRHLGEQASTYQDVQPLFLRELHQAGHEKLPELRDILEQNFLQDEQGRWYVPDPNKASDLEKLRLRSLLREFAEYLEGRGRLKQFRTEAVRAGFSDAWRRRDYATIVKVAGRLPEAVLQEDPELLMYYDNASLRG